MRRYIVCMCMIETWMLFLSFNVLLLLLFNMLLMLLLKLLQKLEQQMLLLHKKVVLEVEVLKNILLLRLLLWW